MTTVELKKKLKRLAEFNGRLCHMKKKPSPFENFAIANGIDPWTIFLTCSVELQQNMFKSTYECGPHFRFLGLHIKFKISNDQLNSILLYSNLIEFMLE